MPDAPTTLTGMSLKWTGRHHSLNGDFHDLRTHTVHYLTDSTCRVTASDKVVGIAGYEYQRLDLQMGLCIYTPEEYQGRSDIVLNAMFDFHAMTDRAVITAAGKPFAVADGTLEFVATPGWI